MRLSLKWMLTPSEHLELCDILARSFGSSRSQPNDSQSQDSMVPITMYRKKITVIKGFNVECVTVELNVASSFEQNCEERTKSIFFEACNVSLLQINHSV